MRPAPAGSHTGQTAPCRDVYKRQERFTRCKTLGEAYTEEAITERIKGRSVERKPKENRKISLRIDLENSIKAQQSAGYELSLIHI